VNSNQNNVLNLVLVQIQPGEAVTEEKIKNLVEVFSTINALTDEEKAEVIKLIHSKLAIRMDRGAFVKSFGHVSWYYNAKRQMSTKYWDRYRNFLISNNGLNNDVISTLDYSTDEIMDLLGNPNTNTEFQRRGLVIGDVQSGKTSTYTALINKAADSGYKIIILLTGTIEKLRQQTQTRLDEGFVGLDSTAFNVNRDNVLVGVGNIDPSVSAWAVTSTSSDFNISTARKLSGKLSSISDPVLFVLKKNKSVLEKLEQWMRIFNANQLDRRIDLPMLLIDDEADNASVNTREDEDPTVINQNIRKLLKLFVKANYVGFTATPFANIFINPDTTSEMLSDDLFPRDFIFALEPATNYVGARDIFGENSKYGHMIFGKENDDCEYVIPLNHKKDFDPTGLPKSLELAIGSFFIANAIRDLRGQTTKHRSMLVNVSRFINVQNKLQRQIDQFVRDTQRTVRNYSRSNDSEKYESIAFLKMIFETYFSSSEFGWNQILSVLSDSISPIVTRSVNGGNATKNLNYDENKEEGLRLIAVGGYSLSRGLTLEGLTVSYFYRNSKMYDTLMQMGRWFGFRDGYSDLCQIWMSENAISWYSYISEAADELRKEVRRMQAENKTPQDFGLCVRSDITALLVTARNKMKSARDYIMTVSLNGKMIETPFLHNDHNINLENLNTTLTFLKNLIDSGYHFSNDTNLAITNPQILNVPQEKIVEYLGLFNSHHLNFDFRPFDLVNLIREYDDGSLDNWDIVIAGGSGAPIDFLGKQIQAVVRKFDIKISTKAIQLSGSKSRLGSKTFAKGGLSKEQVTAIEENERAIQAKIGELRSFNEDMYFNTEIKRNPLLVIYPVALKPTIIGRDRIEVEEEKRRNTANELPFPLIGLSIGIPRTNGGPSKTFQYKINIVKFREIFEIGEIDFNDISEDD
jgi:hypothetical protein